MPVANRRARGKFSIILAAVAATSCGKWMPQGLVSRKAPAQLDDQSRDGADQATCLGIRSGTLVEPDSEFAAKYSSVGSIDADGAICTGNLIAPNVVLTAGHCVEEVTQPGPNPNDPPVRRANPLRTDPALITFTLGEKVRSIVDVIYYQDSPYQDVALLVLDEAFDETVSYYEMVRSRLTATQVTEVVMIGNGVFTDGANTANASVLDLRAGTANFAGYTNTSLFIDSVPSLRVTPKAAGGQLVCPGDSGSSLFWDSPAQPRITGITSFGSVADNTNSITACASAIDAFFVPADSIATWVDAQLEALEVQPARPAESVMVATITNLENDTDGKMLTLGGIAYVSDGLGLAQTSQQAVLCSTECPPALLLAEPALNARLVVKLQQDGGRLIVSELSPLNQPRRSKVQFTATISDATADFADTFGRSQRSLQLMDVKATETTALAPQFADGKITGNICISGCAETTTLPVGSELKDGQKITVAGEYITGQGLFLRDVSLVPEVVEAEVPSQCVPAE